MTTTRVVTVSLEQIDYWLDVLEWSIKALAICQAAGRGEAEPGIARVVAQECPLVLDEPEPKAAA